MWNFQCRCHVTVKSDKYKTDILQGQVQAAMMASRNISLRLTCIAVTMPEVGGEPECRDDSGGEETAPVPTANGGRRCQKKHEAGHGK